MARTKITVYAPPDLIETLKRAAAAQDRSVSDIVVDAVVYRFSDPGREAENAAIMNCFATMDRRFGALQKGLEAQFELTAQAARFAMSIVPEIPAQDRPMLTARGADRLRNVLAIVAASIASGKSMWRGLLNSGD